MYNSTNLPLSPKKIIKKTIVSQHRVLPWLIILSSFYLVLKSPLILSDTSSNLQSLSIFLVIFIIVLELGVIIYQYYYYKLYYYNFTEQQGEIRKGVISRATGLVRYERLQNIYVDQDILDRLFGLYDVHYETAGETSGFYSHVDGLIKENADKLVAFLNERANRQNNYAATKATPPPPHASAPTTPSTLELSRQTCPIERKIIMINTLTYALAGGLISFFIIVPNIYREDPPLIILLGVLTPIIIIGLLAYWYSIVWFKNFNFTFYTDKGEVVSKVISQSQTYLYYDRIQNVNVNQGIVERLFNLFSVDIETAGGAVSLLGLNSENAEKIKTFLLERARNYKHRL